MTISEHTASRAEPPEGVLESPPTYEALRKDDQEARQLLSKLINLTVLDTECMEGHPQPEGNLDTCSSCVYELARQNAMLEVATFLLADIPLTAPEPVRLLLADIPLTAPEPVKLSIKLAQKARAADYESSDCEMFVSGITEQHTDQDIERLLDQGRIAYTKMAERLSEEVHRVRRQGGY